MGLQKRQGFGVVGSDLIFVIFPTLEPGSGFIVHCGYLLIGIIGEVGLGFALIFCLVFLCFECLKGGLGFTCLECADILKAAQLSFVGLNLGCGN